MAAQDKDNAAKTREVRESIDKLVEGALQALDRFAAYDQKQVDDIVRAMALAGVDHHMALAKQAVEETGRGVFEDKITKNLFATEYIYHSIKYEKTVGIIEDNDQEGYVELAEPVGVVCAVTPTTNPTSTARSRGSRLTRCATTSTRSAARRCLTRRRRSTSRSASRPGCTPTRSCGRRSCRRSCAASSS